MIYNLKKYKALITDNEMLRAYVKNIIKDLKKWRATKIKMTGNKNENDGQQKQKCCPSFF